MKKVIVLAVVLALAAVAGWQIWVRVQAARPEARRPRPPVAVEVGPVRRGTIDDVGVFTGSLLPRRQFLVAPKIAGRVEKLAVNIGESVERGQLIAILDDEELVQQVEQAQAELDVAKANVENRASDLEVARREYDRIQTLREKKVASESELDAAESLYKTSQARAKVAAAEVAQREALLKAARVRLGYTRVEAHWDEGQGPRVVGERFVDEGALLKANEPIISVLQEQLLTGVINVIERDYPKVRVGQEASIATDAYPGERFTGRIVRIAPFLRESSRQARLELDVPNADLRLKAGMFIRAFILFGRHEGATLVPVAALVKRAGKEGVFLADPKARTARFVPVRTGIRSGETIEVLEPAALEGLVVTLGQHLLEDGSPIRLPAEPGRPKADDPEAAPAGGAETPAAARRPPAGGPP
jgi:RND family efflux transporter MFP subunit